LRMWSLSTGTAGRIEPESVVGLDWNGWSLSIGISGRIRLDYARLSRQPKMPSKILSAFKLNEGQSLGHWI
jgi:hypothetical protein